MSHMSARVTALHLTLIQGVGPATVAKLMPLEGLYQLHPSDFMERYGVTQATAQKLAQGLADSSLLEKELELIERFGISWTTCFDPDYPPLLKTIELPPVILYWQGQHPGTFNKCCALIGSRRANAYGARIVRLLVPDLVKRGWCIVSGGALGADTFAHRAALEAQGTTIAVLGSGLLQPYPQQNSALFQIIREKGGTVLSSFPLTMTAQAGHFPARNRIIAGLSRGCLVIQAAARSGALITARYALEQGREVGAVPGPIDDELSAGCHALISQGACLVSSTRDIIELLEGVGSDVLEHKSDQLEQIGDTASTLLMQLCKKPISFDELLEKTDLSAAQLYEKLFTLQVEGALVQDSAGLWSQGRC
jgi:DNA processing protein